MAKKDVEIPKWMENWAKNRARGLTNHTTT